MGQVPDQQRVTSGLMDAQTAQQRAAEVFFLDVREPNEWEAGHIEGAVNIPLMELPTRYEELATDKPIVAVCQIGQRSELAAGFLKENGFQAHNLEGGMKEWARLGLPFVSTPGDERQVVDGYARDFRGLL
jgi:rhodanese-related sulfurtransferase